MGLVVLLAWRACGVGVTDKGVWGPAVACDMGSGFAPKMLYSPDMDGETWGNPGWPVVEDPDAAAWP